MLIQRSIPWLLGALLLAVAGGAAAERPPAGSKPLSEILQGVEKSNPGVVVSAEIDDGRWEVVVCEPSSRRCREIYVDPRSGQERRSNAEWNSDVRPPPNGKMASQVARALEDLKLGDISDLDYDDPHWEADIRGDRARMNLRVDPMSGEVRRCIGLGCPAR
ncbi:PepSY domain-containing protein [Rivibacter subsaxonicus]|uniref:YpeB-like protein with putative protease inhibitory function n=1 Tax=Rivibacter subsaxonicus TaxID=457575 RepID=A0A4V2FSC8_9BURK|nr:PepSY domain-containing protein [Rivibacter subsaxonicus]RZT93859.1 YpeB-like protein with putative protease inhibitory function [Rivibacter subsaxonicus]